jgi:hypothetical protein
LPEKALEANKIKLDMLQASVSKQAYIDQVNTNSFENITRDLRGSNLKNYLSLR